MPTWLAIVALQIEEICAAKSNSTVQFVQFVELQRLRLVQLLFLEFVKLQLIEQQLEFFQFLKLVQFIELQFKLLFVEFELVQLLVVACVMPSLLYFARTRAYADMLAEQFDDAGIRAVALHGDLNQAKRTRNLQRLTDGKVSVLVATDVAARGIHVDGIDLVVQADAPDEYKTYLHRAGRTGRAGRAGTVVTLIPRQRRRRMTELLEHAEIEAPFDDVRPGDDLLEELAGRQVDPIA